METRTYEKRGDELLVRIDEIASDVDDPKKTITVSRKWEPTGKIDRKLSSLAADKAGYLAKAVEIQGQIDAINAVPDPVRPA